MNVDKSEESEGVDVLMETFASRQLELLQSEREAEVESYRQVLMVNSVKALERMGVGLFNLQISEHCIGMFGRHILTLTKVHRGSLGSPSLKSGDVVSLSSASEFTKAKQDAWSLNSSASNGAVNATITKISANFLTLTCDSLPKCISDCYSSNLSGVKDLAVSKVPSDVTYKRLSKAAKRVLNGSGNKGGIRSFSVPLMSYLFSPQNNLSMSGQLVTSDDQTLDWFNCDLNESQMDCAHFCLMQKHMAVIHGPPGTGKTTTVVEVILQEVKRGNRVLACAPSNVAVDNLLVQLFRFRKEAGLKMMRLGHPARASDTSKMFTVDSLILESDFSQVIKELRQEIFRSKQLLAIGNTAEKDRQGFRDASKSLPGLKKDLKQLEEKCIVQLLENSNVVLSTCTSAHEDGTFRLAKDKDSGLFDVCVIDECGQAVECESWIPILTAKKVILAGDHMQLPPTVMSQEAEKAGLGVSLLERMVNKHPEAVKLLDIQYRMNSVIMNWASVQFYEGKLRFGTSEVETRSLQSLLNVDADEISGENEFLLNCGMMMIDTNGCEMFELETENEESKGNEAEADLVAYHVNTLIKLGVPQSEIAVISPYNLQIELIRSRISQVYPSIEIRSVDGFQGREKEAIVLSLVRSNANFEIGFLAESRRLNVAITRAKRHVCVIGDSKTISVDKTLKGLVDYIELNGVAFTASDYVDKPDMEWTFSHKRTQNAPDKAVKSAIAGKPKATKPVMLKRVSNGDVYFDKKALLLEVDQFVSKEQRREVKFPKSLPAAARAFLHEEAEKRGLKHDSVGTGSSRRIVISKLTKTTEGSSSENGTQVVENENSSSECDSTEDADKAIPQVQKTSNFESNRSKSVEDSDLKTEDVIDLYSGFDQKEKTLWSEDLIEDENVDQSEQSESLSTMSNVDSKTVLCSICSKNIPQFNFETHVLHCAKLKSKKDETGSKAKAEGSRKTFKEKTKSKIETLPEDDFEGICEAFQNLNKVCNEARCKTNIVTLSFKCNYCECLFCSQHRCPESHGCDRASVKRKARQNMRDPPPPVKTSHKQNHDMLQGKVKHRLEEMRKSRNSKRGPNN